MATPSCIETFTRFPNALIEILFKLKISGSQFQLLLFIIRKTHGWGKKVDPISISQFVEGTGQDKRHIWRGLQDLVARNIIIKGKRGNTSTYGVQEVYSSWQIAPKKTYGKNGDSCISRSGVETIDQNGEHKRKEKNNKEREDLSGLFGQDCIRFLHRYAQKNWTCILDVLEAMVNVDRLDGAVSRSAQELLFEFDRYEPQSVIQACKSFLVEIDNGMHTEESRLFIHLDEVEASNAGNACLGPIVCQTPQQNLHSACENQ